MIRKAVRADAVAINAISKELGYEELTKEIADDRIKRILESETDDVYVFDEGQIKGWIHIFVANRIASPPFLEIGGLAVSSEFQRKGIGKQLVEYAISLAREQNMKTRVRCNARRTEAHEFYIALGLAKTKEQCIFEVK